MTEQVGGARGRGGGGEEEERGSGTEVKRRREVDKGQDIGSWSSLSCTIAVSFPSRKIEFFQPGNEAKILVQVCNAD